MVGFSGLRCAIRADSAACQAGKFAKEPFRVQTQKNQAIVLYRFVPFRLPCVTCYIFLEGYLFLDFLFLFWNFCCFSWRVASVASGFCGFWLLWLLYLFIPIYLSIFLSFGSCSPFSFCIFFSCCFRCRDETSKQASKQASASCSPLDLVCCWGGRCAPPNPSRATKSALHPRHPRLPRNQYFKVSSPVQNFLTKQICLLYLSIYLSNLIYSIFLSFYLSAVQHPQSTAPATNLHFKVHKVLRLPRNLHSKAHKVLHLPPARLYTSTPTKSCICHEICTSRSTKSCACHKICTPRATKYYTCHEICTSRPTKCPAPATNSALQGPQSPAPATKCALQGPQSTAPATKHEKQKKIQKNEKKNPEIYSQPIFFHHREKCHYEMGGVKPHINRLYRVNFFV